MIKVYELYEQYGDKVITHDLHMASAADRVVEMIDGRIVTVTDRNDSQESV